MMKKFVARVLIDGVIDLQKEHEIIGVMKMIERRKRRCCGIAVVINSTGGSLRSAKIMADAFRKIRDQLEIPVFCFSQNFCLNSANVLLTSGTRCYINKFSIVSNFGYTKHYFDLEEFQKDRNIKPFNSGSLMPKTTMGGPFDPLAFTDQAAMRKVVEEHTKELKETIIANRLHDMQFKKKSPADMEAKVFGMDSVMPNDAVECGFVDGVSNFSGFMGEHFPDARLLQMNSPMFEYPVMNKAYSLLYTIKQTD